MVLPRFEKQAQELQELYGDDAVKEFMQSDPVTENIVYHRFVSKSKGWRYSKKRGRYKRMRKHWKEIELLHCKLGNQTDNKFNQKHRFPFDVVAQEVFNNPYVEPYALENRIDDIWGH